MRPRNKLTNHNFRDYALLFGKPLHHEATLRMTNLLDRSDGEGGVKLRKRLAVIGSRDI